MGRPLVTVAMIIIVIRADWTSAVRPLGVSTNLIEYIKSVKFDYMSSIDKNG